MVGDGQARSARQSRQRCMWTQDRVDSAVCGQAGSQQHCVSMFGAQKSRWKSAKCKGTTGCQDAMSGKQEQIVLELTGLPRQCRVAKAVHVRVAAVCAHAEPRLLSSITQNRGLCSCEGQDTEGVSALQHLATSP
eukprot:1157541-Pelagomonas_calceolata.AAC.6